MPLEIFALEIQIFVVELVAAGLHDVALLLSTGAKSLGHVLL